MKNYEYIPGMGIFYKKSSISVVDVVNRLNTIGKDHYTYVCRGNKNHKDGFTRNSSAIKFSEVNDILNESEEEL